MSSRASSRVSQLVKAREPDEEFPSVSTSHIPDIHIRITYLLRPSSSQKGALRHLHICININDLACTRLSISPFQILDLLGAAISDLSSDPQEHINQRVSFSFDVTYS